MISPITICYALKITHDFLRSKYLLEKTEYNRKCLEELSDAVDEIDDGKFEIEGYECNKWIKYDADDESTHPASNTRVLVSIDSQISLGFFRDFEIDRWGKGVKTAYWRPLPKPPPGAPATFSFYDKKT